jgi:hypothetical protein
MMTFTPVHGIMWDVADPNESHSNHQDNGDDARPVEAAEASEIVEAVVVETTREPTATTEPDATPNPQDDEAFRQYQQFLEFQKFQEWQRQQGTYGSTAPTATRANRPWWKHLLGLLRFKFVRRLLYLLLAVVLILMAINHFFGSGGHSDGGGTPSGNAPGTNPHPGWSAGSSDPGAAVIGVYNYIAYTPDVACSLFTDSGKAAFAAASGAPDCTSAARQLHAQVANPVTYSDPQLDQNAVPKSKLQPDLSVTSCQIQVTDGPPLGDFHLHRQPDGGWMIDGYQKQTPHCPAG